MTAKPRLPLVTAIVIFVWCLSSDRAAGEDAEPARSLVELRSSQRRHSERTVRFDFEARIAFAADDWNRIRLQNSSDCFWARSTPIIRNHVESLSVGDRIRIQGCCSPHDHIPDIESLEIVEAGNVSDLIAVPAFESDRVNHFRFVTATGIVQQIFVGGPTSRLLIDVDGRELAADVFGSFNRDDLDSILGRRVQVSGSLGYFDSVEGWRNRRLRLLMMDSSQVRFEDADQSPTPSGVSVSQGVVSFVANDYLLVDGFRLNTELAPLAKLGHLVDYVYRSQPDEIKARQTLAIRQLAASRLPDAVVMSGAELHETSSMYRRCTLTGWIKESSYTQQLLEVSIDSDGTPVTAIIQHKGPVAGADALPVGSLIRVTGTLDKTLDDAGNQKFVLQTLSSEDVSPQSFAVQFPTSYLKWGIAGILGVIGLGMAWQFSLRRQVASKTRELVALNAQAVAVNRAVRDVILLFDADGNVAQCDERIEELFGAELTVGMTWRAALDEITKVGLDREDDLKEFWESAFQIENEARSAEFRLGPSGRWIAIYTADVVSGSGDSLGRIWAFDEITERKLLEEKFLQSQKFNAIGRLAGGVAHDFNNLLQIVGANLDSVRVNSSEANAKAQIDSASLAVDRAAELTRQLLTYSRRSTISTEVVSISFIVNEVCSLMRNSFGNDVEFVTSISPDAWDIEADTGMIEQVLVNLCLNAKDAIPGDSGRIEISARNVTNPTIGDCLRVTVQDDGAGIPAEILEHVFEPFYTTKGVGRGTGLGLATAHGIVMQHGGLIRCESVQGEGTRVEILLPRAATAVVTAPPFGTQPAIQGQQAKRILLIDDEPLIRESVERLLTCLGHSVVCAAGGQQGLDALAADRNFDLVILDLTMPQMSGRETLQKIREAYPDTRVVICSGYSSDAQEISDSETIRPDGYLGKPFRIDDFNRLLDAEDIRRSVAS